MEAHTLMLTGAKNLCWKGTRCVCLFPAFVGAFVTFNYRQFYIYRCVFPSEITDNRAMNAYYSIEMCVLCSVLGCIIIWFFKIIIVNKILAVPPCMVRSCVTSLCFNCPRELFFWSQRNISLCGRHVVDFSTDILTGEVKRELCLLMFWSILIRVFITSALSEITARSLQKCAPQT